MENTMTYMVSNGVRFTLDESTQVLVTNGSAAVRREFEGPDMRELNRGAGPVKGWEGIEEARLTKQLTGGYTPAQLNDTCPVCFVARSVTGQCFC
jgi:hypothetical protein